MWQNLLAQISCRLANRKISLEVQQRGVAATGDVLTALLDGVEPENGRVAESKVFVLDVLPSRQDPCV